MNFRRWVFSQRVSRTTRRGRSLIAFYPPGTLTMRSGSSGRSVTVPAGNASTPALLQRRLTGARHGLPFYNAFGVSTVTKKKSRIL